MPPLSRKEGTPEAVYVKYRKTKGQRISQQAFHPGDIPVKGAKPRGNQMTLKPIEKLADRKPAWWDDAAVGPRGAML